VSVRPTMSQISANETPVVQVSSARQVKRTKYKEAEIPKNTIVAVVSDESGEWSGTEEKS